MESFDDLQVGDKVTVCRFYYVSPEKQIEGEVVGVTKRYLKVKWMRDNSDVPHIGGIKEVVGNFRRDRGRSPGESSYPPTYFLRRIKE